MEAVNVRVSRAESATSRSELPSSWRVRALPASAWGLSELLETARSKQQQN